MLANCPGCLSLVLSHGAGLANDVGGRDRGESAILGHHTPKTLR
jgi:hypothetical protein